tara:strand:+ start:839 stop:1162 length:324 start_codon:yes stop_codon:yes gene_type:complete
MEKEVCNQNCWDCAYRKDSQLSLFGKCYYFVELKKEPKDITKDIVDKGCKFFVWVKDNKADRIIRHIVKVFKGELLKNKNPRQVSLGFQKKRKYKDTRHKYGERKDW